jgi:hypothetical protein
MAQVSPTRSALIGAFGAAIGAGGMALLGDVKGWAEIVERVGVPMTTVLILLAVFMVVVKVFGQPLLATHISLVTSLKETAAANAEASRMNAEAVVQLKNLAEVQQATLTELLNLVKAR